MTCLLNLLRLGTPTLSWVGRGGLADMAGKRPLCAMGPMMSALNFRFLFFKKKEERILRVHEKVVNLQAEINRGTVR
jgi:hypothetical protein